MALLTITSEVKRVSAKVAANVGKAAGMDSSSLIALAASATIYSSESCRNPAIPG